jgi:hypothetical protein
LQSLRLGGIFPAGEPDDDGFLTALFEERRELAEHLPVDALTGFRAEACGIGGKEPLDAAPQCSAAIARLANVMQSKTCEYALHSIGTSRAELDDLGIALEISLSETLAEAAVAQGKATASKTGQKVEVRGRNGKMEVKIVGKEDRKQSLSEANVQERLQALSPMDISLSLMTSMVVRQSSQDAELAREVLTKMRGLTDHLKALAAAQDGPHEKTTAERMCLKFGSFTDSSLDEYMKLLGELAKQGDAQVEDDACGILIDVALLRGNVRHIVHALSLLEGARATTRRDATARLIAAMLDTVALAQEPAFSGGSGAGNRFYEALWAVASEYFEALEPDVVTMLERVTACLVRSLVQVSHTTFSLAPPPPQSRIGLVHGTFWSSCATPRTLNPKPSILDPKPQTPNPTPQPLPAAAGGL